MARHLTDRLISAIRPRKTTFFTYDDEVTGLALKCYPSGARSFTFEGPGIDGKVKRKVLGAYPTMRTARARELAGRLRLQISTGESPLVGRGPKLVDLAKRWRDVVARTRRPGSLSGYMQALDKHILPQFGGRDPRTITRNEVESWHANVAETAPVGCNRVLAVMSALMSWLEHDGLISKNPCRGVRRRPETPRHIYLDADEITRATELLNAEPDRASALALLIATQTGARIGEVLTMSAEQVDLGRAVWIKPASSTKQKRVHVSPLSKSTLPLITEYLSFDRRPPYHRCLITWRRVAAALGRPAVRVHDLRHSKASSLARSGASLLQIGKILGHTATTTTSRYAHLIADDLRDLMERTS